MMVKNHRTLATWRQRLRMWGDIDNGGMSSLDLMHDCLRQPTLDFRAWNSTSDMGRDLWLKSSDGLGGRSFSSGEVPDLSNTPPSSQEERVPRGCTSMFCTNVRESLRKHRWGNCMLGCLPRGCPSRSFLRVACTPESAISLTIGGLDLAWLRVLRATSGVKSEWRLRDFALPMARRRPSVHGFKSLPMLFRNEFIGDPSD